MWDYAELTHNAKLDGGPEQFINNIESNAIELGRLEGREEMAPMVGAAAGVGMLVSWGTMKLIQYIKKRKALARQNIDEAKQELLDEIENSSDDLSDEVDESYDEYEED